MVFDVCVIGHITRDLIRIQNVEKQLPGGVAYYFTMAVKNLGLNVSLITKCSENDKTLLDDLIENDVDIFYSRSNKTTTFENIYPKDSNSRIQTVKSVAAPFHPQEMPQISPRYFHLGPLTKKDISLDLLRALSKQSKVSLDVQGCLRTVGGGTITYSDWREKNEGLTYVNILKADEVEARILTGEDHMEKAADTLSTYGIDEVVITLGSKGSLICSKGKLYRIPSFPPKKVVDPTGCGDTYIAGYLFKRLKSSPIFEAGNFAAAVASLKMERHGSFKGTEKDVEKFLEMSRVI
ncbi:MAG: PfkB family carbohydrate kinase [candidate division NC10 bacterium]|nr:PfkB family carbohydrate kinase [candidate division NC10 bacterium]